MAKKKTAKASRKKHQQPPEPGSLMVIQVDDGITAVVRSEFIPPINATIEIKNWIGLRDQIRELTVTGHKWVLDDANKQFLVHVLTKIKTPKK